ncbi:hypothetical protein Leryth_024426, partial [Lithospermum erythrorhizon]
MKVYAVLSKEFATTHRPASSTIQLERQHYSTTDHQTIKYEAASSVRDRCHFNTVNIT